MSNLSMNSEELPDLEDIITYLQQGGTVAKANQISSSALEALYAMAYRRYISGQYEEAAKAFQHLCLYDQWSSRNFLGLGSCQKMLRLYGQAIETYTYAYQLDPDNPLPLIYIADSHRALNNSSKAESVYSTAIQLARRIRLKHKEVNRAMQALASIDNPDREQH